MDWVDAISKAIQYIEEHITEELIADRISENINISSCYFQKGFRSGTECLYMYLPRDAAKKKLNTNYLERNLGIVATMRKLNVVEHLKEIR